MLNIEKLQRTTRMLAVAAAVALMAACGGSSQVAPVPTAQTPAPQPTPAPAPTPVPPSITTQPQDTTVQEPATATFNVAANSVGPVTYQWQRNSSGAWTDLVGATAASYTTAATTVAADNGAQFRVIVANAAGRITSGVAALTVTPAPIQWQADARLAGGGTHTLAIRTNGELWSWGTNNGGALGRANGSTVTAPSAVTTLGATVRSVAGGAWYSVALKTDGTVWAWGNWNNVGPAVGAPPAPVLLPQQVTGLANIRAVASRYNHTLALKEDGTVWGFGPENFDALGPATGNGAARQVPGLSGIRQIAAGEQHSMALRDDGTVYTWGRNSQGQLGINTGGASRTAPQTVALTNVVAIAAISFRSYALRSDGTVWEWGGSPAGFTPVAVAGATGIKAIAGGNYTMHALRTDGTVLGWGDNTFGRVGIGSTQVTITTATALPGLANIVELAGAEFHALALGGDGRVFGYGSNGNAQITGSAGSDSNVAIFTGFTR
jgi:alpha-tubulin suppressor-like RCC1 family protein